MNSPLNHHWTTMKEHHRNHLFKTTMKTHPTWFHSPQHITTARQVLPWHVTLQAATPWPPEARPGWHRCPTRHPGGGSAGEFCCRSSKQDPTRYPVVTIIFSYFLRLKRGKQPDFFFLKTGNDDFLNYLKFITGLKKTNVSKLAIIILY